MRIVLISGMVARSGKFPGVLRHMEERRKALVREGVFVNRPLLAATWGHTDIVECQEVNDVYALYASPNSPWLAVRNPVGGCIPAWLNDALAAGADLDARIEVTPLDGVMADDPERPFVAVHYFKLAPLAKSLVAITPAGEGGPETLAGTIARAFTDKSHPVWEHYRAIETAATAGTRYHPNKARVTLLLGLDHVELIAIVRAARLEQYAAFVEGTRLLTIEEAIGPGSLKALPDAARRKRALGVGDDWTKGPAFAETVSMVGMQLVVPGMPGSWRVRRPAKDQEAAHRARLLVRMHHPPGSRADETRQLQGLRDLFPSGAESPPRPASIAFGFFGPFEVLPSKPSSLRVGQLADSLEILAGLGQNQTLLGASSSTVEVVLGNHERDPPVYAIADKLTRRLQDAKERLLYAGEPPDGNWIKAWQKGASAHGLSYALANAGADLLGEVVGRLDDNLDNFLDLLVPARQLVQSPNKNETDAIEDLLYVLEAMVSVRPRRDSVVHPPTAPRAFQGYAGYSTARNALTSFVRSAAAILGQKAPLVMEAFGRSPVLRVLGGGNFITSVSPIGVHHPHSWIHPHEIGHYPRDPTARESTVHDRVAKILQSFVRGPLVRNATHIEVEVADAIMGAIKEMLADVPLWRLLRLRHDEDPSVTGLRLWFVLGPALVDSIRHGPGRSPTEDLQVFLRVVLTSIFLESGDDQIAGDLRAVLGPRLLDDDALLKGASTTARRALQRVRTLREDLTNGGERPVHTLPTLAEFPTLSNVSRLIPNLAEVVRDLRTSAGDQGSSRGAPGATDAHREILTTYARYVEHTRGLARDSLPNERPWLMYVPHHESEMPMSMSLRGGPVFDKRTLEGQRCRTEYYASTFELLMRIEELGRAERYGFFVEALEGS